MKHSIEEIKKRGSKTRQKLLQRMQSILRLGEHYEQLSELIGPQAAIETVIATLERKEPCQ